ncbi:MAG: WYL domain-containing protein [Magnetococcales bacterium]|nr:WYL domain-containing protein [Magnetococcales bacterium]
MTNPRNTPSMDTLLRQWNMLRLLPRFPHKISTPEIHQRLEELEFYTTLRTVQRDLDKLSAHFQIYADDFKPRGWCWAKDAQPWDVPSMDPQTALTLQILIQHANRLLPLSTLRYLRPHADLAKKVLSGLTGSDLASWPEKVRVIHPGPLLVPPRVQPDVLDVVYAALLENRCFRGAYRSRDKQHYRENELNPLGLVFKGGIAYLVCTYMGPPNVYQMALHRFRSAELMDTKSIIPEGFSLDTYIANGHFGYLDGHIIHLKLRLHDDVVVRFLSETPLAEKQEIHTGNDGATILEADLPQSAELRWWLLSYGAAVEVLEPTDFRILMSETIEKMSNRYE